MPRPARIAFRGWSYSPSLPSIISRHHAASPFAPHARPRRVENRYRPGTAWRSRIDGLFLTGRHPARLRPPANGNHTDRRKQGKNAAGRRQRTGDDGDFLGRCAPGAAGRRVVRRSGRSDRSGRAGVLADGGGARAAGGLRRTERLDADPYAKPDYPERVPAGDPRAVQGSPDAHRGRSGARFTVERPVNGAPVRRAGGRFDAEAGAKRDFPGRSPAGGVRSRPRRRSWLLRRKSRPAAGISGAGHATPPKRAVPAHRDASLWSAPAWSACGGLPVCPAASEGVRRAGALATKAVLRSAGGGASRRTPSASRVGRSFGVRVPGCRLPCSR